MNFNVYVDQKTDEQLGRLAKRRQLSRNAVVREAIAMLVERESNTGWPESVMNFSGIATAARFEDHRDSLQAVPTDPLATSQRR